MASRFEPCEQVFVVDHAGPREFGSASGAQPTSIWRDPRRASRTKSGSGPTQKYDQLNHSHRERTRRYRTSVADDTWLQRFTASCSPWAIRRCPKQSGRKAWIQHEFLPRQHPGLGEVSVFGLFHRELTANVVATEPIMLDRNLPLHFQGAVMAADLPLPRTTYP